MLSPHLRHVSGRFSQQVCDEQIAAHKLILMTQCDYFRKMLTPDNFVEGQSGVVTVNDTTPAAFRALLRYLYTGRSTKTHAIVLGTCVWESQTAAFCSSPTGPEVYDGLQATVVVDGMQLSAVNGRPFPHDMLSLVQYHLAQSPNSQTFH